MFYTISGEGSRQGRGKTLSHPQATGSFPPSIQGLFLRLFIFLNLHFTARVTPDEKEWWVKLAVVGNIYFDHSKAINLSTIHGFRELSELRKNHPLHFEVKIKNDL